MTCCVARVGQHGATRVTSATGSTRSARRTCHVVLRRDEPNGILALLATGSYDISIHPRHLSVLPTVMFHPRFRHDIQTTAEVFYLKSSGRSTRSSLYS